MDAPAERTLRFFVWFIAPKWCELQCERAIESLLVRRPQTAALLRRRPAPKLLARSMWNWSWCGNVNIRFRDMAYQWERAWDSADGKCVRGTQRCSNQFFVYLLCESHGGKSVFDSHFFSSLALFEVIFWKSFEIMNRWFSFSCYKFNIFILRIARQNQNICCKIIYFLINTR